MAIVPKFEEFTASGTWTYPASIVGDVVYVTLVGGGGGGSGTGANGEVGSGGGGAAFWQRQPITLPDTSDVSVTIASGGSGGSGANGSDGGSSSFGALLTAGPGDGATRPSTKSNSLQAGAGSPGGEPGMPGFPDPDTANTDKVTLYAAGGKSRGPGGTGYHSNGGNTTGESAAANSGGGGAGARQGTTTDQNGGDGGSGYALIEWFEDDGS